MKRALILLAVAMLTLSACAPGRTPTPSPTTAAALLPTDTPAPTATPAHTPSPTATATATPTVTPTPIPTLPPEQLGGLSGVPDPRSSNPELFDLNDPDAPIPQFVNAMRMAGIEVAPEQVVQGLEFEVITGADGKEYVVGSYTVTDEAGTPYSVAVQAERNEKGEWRWRTMYLKDVCDIHSITCGTSADGYETHLFEEGDQTITETVSRHFNAIYPTEDFYLTINERSSNLSTYINFAERNGLIFFMGNGFWHLNADHLKGKTSDEIKQFIQDYPKRIFAHFKDPSESNIKRIVVTYFNEPVWYDSGNVGWLKSPYFEIYGEDGIRMLTETYIAYYRAAEEYRLQPGEFVRLAVGLDGVFTPNKKASFVHDALLQVKKEIARELGILPDEVQLDVALQIRVDAHDPYDSSYGFYPPASSPEEIKKAIELFSDIGKIHIVEFEVNGEPNDPRRAELLNAYTKAIIAAGEQGAPIESIIYFGPIRSATSQIPVPPAPFFDNRNDFAPTSTYFELLATILEFRQQVLP